jgi:2-C-methyl-D-erythritol 2,4-cyclodiphosphate synthase
MFRIGNGYDVHPLVKERKLILGGVEIPHDLGLGGHSDADVLLHAICDAILGACGAGDIGHHFPDTSGEYKNISSLLLLKRVARTCADRGYKISNTDAIIVAQEPKVSPYIVEMITNIAAALDIETTQVNIKATTTEKLGFEGRKEGISAHAIALLEKI